MCRITWQRLKLCCFPIDKFTPNRKKGSGKDIEEDSKISFEMLRHGQTHLNSKSNGPYMQGWSNGAEAQLTFRGARQAEQVASSLIQKILSGKLKPYTALISSDLNRAASTAFIIQDAFKRHLKLNIPVFLDARMRSQARGIYEGKRSAESRPELEGLTVNQYSLKYPDWKPPEDGQSLNDATKNIRECIEEILNEKFRGGHLLFISHGNSIGKMMKSAVWQDNCTLTGLVYDPKDRSICVKWEGALGQGTGN